MLAIALVFAALWPCQARAQTPAAIGIDFVGGGTAMSSQETAGVVPRSGWNAAPGASRSTPLPLVDSSGAASGASVTWSAYNVFNTAITDTPGNNRMMNGYLDNGAGGTIGVSVAGLAAGSYDVYVYVDGYNGTASRSGSYQISGPGITTATISLTDAAQASFSGTFVQAAGSAGNFVKFSIAASSFSLTATPGATSDNTPRSPINAVQIVPAGGQPPPPDFSVSVTPASRTITAGGSTTFSVAVTPANGFAGTVSFAVSGLPAGTSASFSPTTITGSGSTTLTITSTAGTPAGSPTLTITGTSGSLTRTATATLTVSPPLTYSLSGTITPTPLGAGVIVSLTGTSTATTTTNASGGYTFSNLSNGSYTIAPAKAGATFSPASRTATIASASVSNVNFTAAAAQTSAGIGIDFVGGGTTMSSQEIAGVVPTSAWNAAPGASRSTPLPLVDSNGTSSGASVTWSAYNVFNTAIADTPGNNRMMRGYLDNGAGGAIVVAVAGLASGAYDVYVYVDGANGSASRSGTYQISGPGITTATISLTDAPQASFSGAFVQAAGSAGNFVRFPIAGSGFTLTATPGATSDSSPRSPINAVQIVPAGGPPPAPDFSVAMTPASRTVPAGGSTTFSVAVTPANGFAGTVSLAVSGLPSGTSASFSPATITGSGSTTLTITSTAGTPVGSPTLTITGTSGTLSRTATATLTVTPPPTYTLSGTITPTPLGAGVTVTLGGAATATTTTNASGGYTFSNLANGAYAVMPSKPGANVSPSSRTVTIAGANVSNVNFTASATQTTYGLSGSIDLPAGAGATVSVTGSTTASTTANASGQYTVGSLPNGTYTVTPSSPEQVFTPASRTVTIQGASVSGIDFDTAGPTKDRANSYDNEWEAEWVAHARSLLAPGGKTAGFVLQIGDSLTHASPYTSWPRLGQGKTSEDSEILTWLRASSWGTSQTSTSNKNGFYLAAADTTSSRGMTSAGGLSTGEFVSGCCNGGPTMPASFDQIAARQLLTNTTYSANMQIDTVISAFSDAQFAVLLLGTNSASDLANVSSLSTIVDRIEAQRIVPILTTIPPRADGVSNDLNIQFNAAVRTLARTRSLPLIDYYQEILLRRPGTTWLGTLMAADGLHPTATGAGFSSDSNPYASGGDSATHTTGGALDNVGYLLRSWITIQKLKEVKRYVIDGINP